MQGSTQASYVLSTPISPDTHLLEVLQHTCITANKSLAHKPSVQNGSSGSTSMLSGIDLSQYTSGSIGTDELMVGSSLKRTPHSSDSQTYIPNRRSSHSSAAGVVAAAAVTDSSGESFSLNEVNCVHHCVHCKNGVEGGV